MTGNRGKGGIRHTSLRSETCCPVMAPASTARRGRGRDGADVDAGNAESEGDYLAKIERA